MSSNPTFDIKNRKDEFKTPPRPTGRLSIFRQFSFVSLQPYQRRCLAQHLFMLYCIYSLFLTKA